MSVAGESIAAAIRKASALRRIALVGYLTAGFPSRDLFREHLLAIASAADVVEIGVPFTDPMADGMTIQRASHLALQAGVTLPWILEQLSSLEPRPTTPLLLMSYLNPLLAFGLQRLAAAAVRCGVAGFIVPDLPHEESGDLRHALAEQQIALVQMVTPVTPPERLRILCAASQGEAGGAFASDLLAAGARLRSGSQAPTGGRRLRRRGRCGKHRRVDLEREHPWLRRRASTQGTQSKTRHPRHRAA